MASLLLFGSEEYINTVLPYYKVDCVVRKKNLDRYDDRLIVEGDLIQAYQKIMGFIAKHLPEGFYIDSTAQAVSTRDKLFREAVVNLLIHREYADSFISKIIIGTNEVICENACKPSHIGEVKIDEFSPDSKNPIIAKAFRIIGRADELGSGMKNMKKYCKAYSDSEPVIIDGDIFKIIIPLKSNKRLVEERDSLKKQIMQYTEDHGFISNKIIRDYFTVTKFKATETLESLLNENLLIREGNGRNTIYRITK